MTREEINQRLEELRVEWQQYPTKRPMTERRARALQIALEKMEKRSGSKQTKGA